MTMDDTDMMEKGFVTGIGAMKSALIIFDVYTKMHFGFPLQTYEWEEHARHMENFIARFLRVHLVAHVQRKLPQYELILIVDCDGLWMPLF